MSMQETQDLITKMVVQNENIVTGIPQSVELVKEYSVDLVANVSYIDIMVKTTCVDANILPHKVIKNIYIEPNSRLAAVNISGEEAAELMKAKYPGKSNPDPGDTGTGNKSQTELYRFDFTDYMQKMKLSLPASAKSLNIKLTIAARDDFCPAIDPLTPDFDVVLLTIRVVQDKAIESRGYRRYFTQDVTLVAATNKFQEIALPRTGLLDSFFLLPSGSIDDIQVEKDDEKYPLKSFSELEKAVAGLHNDEVFEPGYIYCDLARPILAEKTRTLKLKVKNLGAVNDTLRIIYEYVHFD